jgi:uncharacterized membrane protein YraQ (UPF0718 family)
VQAGRAAYITTIPFEREVATLPAFAQVIPKLQTFGTMYLSVLLGALPFILIAVLASGFVELFVSRKWLLRVLPRNPVLGILLVPLIGFFIPLCECAIIPVAGRLVRKGLPLGVGIAFMLANPILNPIPLYSTALAFPFQPEMLALRALLGYGIAVVIGLLVLAFVRKPQLSGLVASAYVTDSSEQTAADQERTVYRQAARAYHRRTLSAPAADAPNLRQLARQAEAAATVANDLADMPMPLGQRFRLALEHSGVEFFVIGRYFMIGAFLASLVQMYVPTSSLAALGQGNSSSVLTMMGMAFLLNLCSEADAFVAAGFAGTFKAGAISAFLVFGPMTDIKNVMMMMATFRRSFAIMLNVAIASLVFFIARYLNVALAGGIAHAALGGY